MLSKQLRWRNFNKYFLYQRTWLIFLFYFGEIPLRHERARIAWPPIMKMKFKCISFSPSPLYLCFFGGIFLVRTGFVWCILLLNSWSGAFLYFLSYQSFKTTKYNIQYNTNLHFYSGNVGMQELWTKWSFSGLSRVWQTNWQDIICICGKTQLITALHTILKIDRNSS